MYIDQALKIRAIAAIIFFIKLVPKALGQYKTRTADYGLYGLRTGYKTQNQSKTRTKHYRLGIKHGLGYKTRTKHYGLGRRYGTVSYIILSYINSSFLVSISGKRVHEEM